MIALYVTDWWLVNNFKVNQSKNVELLNETNIKKLKIINEEPDSIKKIYQIFPRCMVNFKNKWKHKLC